MQFTTGELLKFQNKKKTLTLFKSRQVSDVEEHCAAVYYPVVNGMCSGAVYGPLL